MSNGILSQSIANMQQAEATIQSFSGLPQNAVNIQQNVGEVVAALLPQVQTMQQQVLAFAARLELQLTQQLANTGPFNPEALKAFVDLVQQEIAPIQTLTAQTLTASQSANDRITAWGSGSAPDRQSGSVLHRCRGQHAGCRGSGRCRLYRQHSHR